MEPARKNKMSVEEQAAWSLVSMKHSKPSTEVARLLQESINKRTRNNKILDDDLEKLQEIVRPQAINLPLPGEYFPPVSRLNGLIRKCSMPFEKELSKSDVNRAQSRLIIRKGDLSKLMPLLNADEDLKQGIQVTTYNEAGKTYPMMFKTWGGADSETKFKKVTVLSEGWAEFCENRKLEKGDTVTVWMFREARTDKLCFAITSRKRAGATEHDHHDQPRPPKRRRRSNCE